MDRTSFGPLVLLMLACSACRGTAAVPQPSVGCVLRSDVLVEGRAAPVANDGAAPHALRPLRLGYSLTRLSGRFVGPDVAVELEEVPGEGSFGGNVFAVEVDGVAMRPLVLAPNARQTYALALGLPGGMAASHTVRLTKRTEWGVGEVRFYGFRSRGPQLAPPLPSTRRLLFLGDSITCGYGNRGKGPHCGFAAATEDATLSYAGILARRLGASAQVVAWSGRGVWRNLDGTRAGVVPELWAKNLPGELPDGGEAEAFVPHAVVVNLGTNDAFAGGASAGVIDGPALTQAYVALFERLRAAAPQSAIFVGLGPMLSNSWDAHPMALRQVGWALNAALAERRQKGDQNLVLVGFPSQNGKLGYGCDYHPSVATHVQMAAHLAEVMADRLGWTQDPTFGQAGQIP